MAGADDTDNEHSEVEIRTGHKTSNSDHLTNCLVEKEKDITSVGSGENKDDDDKDISRWTKVARTMALYAVFFAGIGTPLFGVGPCLLDLQILTSSTTQQISYVFTARSIGALIGGCFEGIFIDRKNVWLTMASTTVFSNLMFLLAPLFGDLWTLIIFMGLHGLAYGIFSTSINITVTRIWGKDQGPWMQALHMVGTVGGVISPLLAKPFLSNSVPHVASIDDSVHNHSYANTTSQPPEDAASNVKNFFILVGALGMASSLGCWIVYFRGDRKLLLPRKKKVVLREAESNESSTVARGRYLKQAILSLTFVFYVLLSVYGRGYPNYTMAFTVKYLGWSKLHGALLTSLYLGVYVVGRIGGIFVIARISPQTVIIVDLILSISATIPVILIVKTHVAVYWICTLLYGLGNATIFASGFPWLGQYFKMSGNVGSVPQIGGFVGDILGPPLIGYLFEYVTPMGFVYVSTAGGGICLLLMITMQILAQRYMKLNIAKTMLEIKVGEELCEEDVDRSSKAMDKEFMLDGSSSK